MLHNKESDYEKSSNQLLMKSCPISNRSELNLVPHTHTHTYTLFKTKHFIPTHKKDTIDKKDKTDQREYKNKERKSL